SASSGCPARQAAAISVPPETLHHQISSLPAALTSAEPQRWTSGGSGEPVLPSARMALMPGISASLRPALRTLEKKAAPAPNQVTPALTAKVHRRLQSGASLVPLGEPSKRQMVVPLRSPPTWIFHITQPVALYQ